VNALLFPDRQEVERCIEAALKDLRDRDFFLFIANVNERSITHRLAMYLQQYLPDWDVDCEYNRDRHNRKEMDIRSRGDAPDDDTDARTVFPDIIVHLRGTTDNLLVIEVKKSTSAEGADFDVYKLQEFRRQLGYRHALFIEFLIGHEADFAQCDWIEGPKLGVSWRFALSPEDGL
jgi:hypothetical protein